MKRMTTAVITALIALLVHGIAAAAPSHVEWSARIENKTAEKGTLIITANIESGWHIYGVDMPDMGDEPGVPDATSIEVEPTAGLVMTSATTADSKPTVHFDEFLNLNLPWLQGTVELKRDFELSDGVKGVNIKGYVKLWPATTIHARLRPSMNSPLISETCLPLRLQRLNPLLPHPHRNATQFPLYQLQTHGGSPYLSKQALPHKAIGLYYFSDFSEGSWRL